MLSKTDLCILELKYNTKTEFWSKGERQFYCFARQKRMQQANAFQTADPAGLKDRAGYYWNIQDLGSLDWNLVHAASRVGHIFKVVSSSAGALVMEVSLLSIH